MKFSLRFSGRSQLIWCGIGTHTRYVLYLFTFYLTVCGNAICLQSYVPKVKTGHVAPGVPLDRVKNRLSLVRGALVECPLVGKQLSPLHSSS